MHNPYEPPASRLEDKDENLAPKRSTVLILAAVGAWFAAAYWAALALLAGIGAAVGAVSGLQVILPVILIGLYAVRGYQLFKGDMQAAQRLVWLHGIGGLMAVFTLLKGGGVVAVLYGIKLGIHIFGGITSLLARSER